jgi:hypothetical protein
MFKASAKVRRDVQNRRSSHTRYVVRYLAFLLILLISTGQGSAVADVENPAAGQPGISRSDQPQAPAVGPSAGTVAPTPSQRSVLEEALPEFLAAVAAALVVTLASYLCKKAVARYRRRRRPRHPPASQSNVSP